MASREEVQAIIERIRTDQGLREELRNALLAQELVDLPQVFAIFATKTTTDLEQLKGDMASVKGDMASVKGDMASVKGDMASVKGRLLEDRLKAHPRLVLRALGVEARRLRALTDAEIGDLEASLNLSDAEAIRLSKTDLVAVVASADGSPASYVAVEASWRTGSEDVKRVAASAAILARTGRPARAVALDEAGVAHPHVTEEIRLHGVTHLSNAA